MKNRIIPLCIYYVFRIPRFVRKLFYKRFNRLLLSLLGVEYGKNLLIHNKTYFKLRAGARLKIGDDFVLTSGEAYNPLCRNLRAILYLDKNARITIGDNCGMSSPCVWAKESIKIGNNVRVGGDCIILDNDCHSLDYRIRRKERDEESGCMIKSAPIVIEDDVMIGARCIILKGVTIGARSVIAAGSVVTKSIPSDCIAGGNPCKVIRY